MYGELKWLFYQRKQWTIWRAKTMYDSNACHEANNYNNILYILSNADIDKKLKNSTIVILYTSERVKMGH